LHNWGYAGSHLHVNLPVIYAYAYSHCDSNCDRETNAHSEITFDTEATAESAAEAVSFNGQYIDCQWFVALTNKSQLRWGQVPSTIESCESSGFAILYQRVVRTGRNFSRHVRYCRTVQRFNPSTIQQFNEPYARPIPNDSTSTGRVRISVAGHRYERR
jgi:hypothetical protein